MVIVILKSIWNYIRDNPLNPLSQGDLNYTPLSKGVSLELVEMAGGIEGIKDLRC